MASYGFRRIDVDQLDEDKYADDQSDNINLGPDEGEVQNLLMGRDNVGALKACLKECPSKDRKDAAVMLVVNVLSSFKGSNDINQAVKSLSTEEIDLLMKYIYKGMYTSSNSSGNLLLWHEKTLEKGGKGCIIRAITDRKGV